MRAHETEDWAFKQHFLRPSQHARKNSSPTRHQNQPFLAPFEAYTTRKNKAGKGFNCVDDRIHTVEVIGSNPIAPTSFFEQRRVAGPSPRSGFRQQAPGLAALGLTPARRLKFESYSAHHRLLESLHLGYPRHNADSTPFQAVGISGLVFSLLLHLRFLQHPVRTGMATAVDGAIRGDHSFGFYRFVDVHGWLGSGLVAGGTVGS